MTAFAQPAFAGLIGVAREDMTAPDGIHARNWGAATHDTASGVDRPLLATAIALSDRAGGAPLLLVALDLGFWATGEDEWNVRGALLEQLELPAENVLIALSHTHSGPSTTVLDVEEEGGRLVAEFRDELRMKVLRLGRAAVESMAPGVLDWDVGSCRLARDRDLSIGDRMAVGFNPGAPADGTLVVGRATSSEGDALATIVNYACHPTTLAWENRLLSPDWVGPMRELVERETHAPCLFLQGASGELAPREQHTSDRGAVDSQGRQLGHAVLSVLAGMLPPSTYIVADPIVESGAPLVAWRRRERAPSRRLAALCKEVDLDRRELPPLEQLESQWQAQIGARAAGERLHRQRVLRSLIGDEPVVSLSYWVWRIGDMPLVAQPGETYSAFQTELRRRLGPAVIINMCNGAYLGYLPPRDRYSLPDLYEVWSSPFGPGALETLIDACAATVRELEPSPHDQEDEPSR